MMILSSIHLPGVKSIMALAVLVVLLAWEAILPFFPFPKGRQRIVHGARNVLLGVINGLMTTFVFVGLWWSASTWATKNGFGLFHWLSVPALAEWAMAVLLLDAWTYLWHRLNHRIPFLWRFHRVHHSDPHMDVTTANRFHIGEILLSSMLRIPLILLLGIRLEQIAMYEVLMFAVVQFHHANISVREKWDRRLRVLIVTPSMHKVHHSRWQPETDSNYSSFLSIWDRIFRSFLINRNPETIHMGLEDFDSPEQQTFSGMLKIPFPERGRK